jgi:hypothetical protein
MQDERRGTILCLIRKMLDYGVRLGSNGVSDLSKSSITLTIEVRLLNLLHKVRFAGFPEQYIVRMLLILPRHLFFWAFF